MFEPLRILAAALFTVGCCAGAGSLLLGKLRIRLTRAEYVLFSFATGEALVSLLVFLLAACRLANRLSFLVAGIVILAAAIWKRRAGGSREPGAPLARTPKYLFLVVFAAFTAIYFTVALAPECSPDGSTYHLGLVSRYLREGGFRTIPANLYAYLSQGLEMLFLFAFAFGRHSAAALFHFACLVALPLAMLAYGQRFGFPGAAMAAALLVYLSPVVGTDGTAAYNDVGVALVLFLVFYALQIWKDAGDDRLLIAVGLLAGFAFAIKYTAFLAVPFALLFVMARLRREPRRLARAAAVLAGISSLLMAPWLAKNWITVGNPLAPFFNRWFPNPYVFIEFENYYRTHFQNYGLQNLRPVPLELTVRGGALQGLLGPVFLLLPLALLALRDRRGRHLLLAGAVFTLPYAGNIGTRFLIPPLPFLTLALALALGASGRAAAVLVALHALLSWPAAIGRYADRYAWRIDRIPFRAALRLEGEADYLSSRTAHYGITRMLDERVPPGSKVFAVTTPMEAYTEREVITGYQSACGNTMQQILWSPLAFHYQPTGYLRFRFSPAALTGLRVVQTGSGLEDWTVNELRFSSGGRELPRSPAWRLRAQPNPWDVQMAFDNSAVTPWRARQPLYPGMFVEARFGRAETLDSALIQCACDVEKVQVRLEARDGQGEWRGLADTPERIRVPVPQGLRRQATADLKAAGIDYLLILDGDYYADDFRKQPGAWGLTLAGERPGGRLYRIE